MDCVGVIAGVFVPFTLEHLIAMIFH